MEFPSQRNVCCVATAATTMLIIHPSSIMQASAHSSEFPAAGCSSLCHEEVGSGLLGRQQVSLLAWYTCTCMYPPDLFTALLPSAVKQYFHLGQTVLLSRPIRSGVAPLYFTA